MKYQESEFVFKRCLPSEIGTICDIQERAFEALENPDVLRRNSEEMLAGCLEDPHYTVGAYHGGRPIAFAVLYDGGYTSENLGKDIGLAGEQLLDAVNMKLVIVLPEYRGNGLQKKLTRELEKIAVQKGKKLICATISPDNSFSLRNFEALGYKLHSCIEKYGGLKRNVYFKEI